MAIALAADVLLGKECFIWVLIFDSLWCTRAIVTAMENSKQSMTVKHHFQIENEINNAKQNSSECHMKVVYDKQNYIYCPLV